MKRMVGFVILVLAVLVYAPRIAAQSSQAPTPDRIVFPNANNWLLSYWYCDPADCFDYVVALTYGYAYTDAKGTPFGGWYTVKPFAVQTATAQNCTSTVFLETGPATFRLTTKKWYLKTYGMEGLIVPSQVTQYGAIIGLGCYDLEWSDGTFSTVPFVTPC